MADYSVRNLRDVTDVAPRFGFDEIQEARFVARELAAEQTGLAYHRYKPGKRGGAHRHDAAEEIYVVVAGSGRASLDGEIVELTTMDALRVAAHVARAFAAGPDGLDLLVFGPHHKGDGELIDGDVWAD